MRAIRRHALAEIQQHYEPAVFTSAVNGIGLEKLNRKLVGIISHKDVEMRRDIPAHHSKTISTIHDLDIYLS